MPTDIFKIQPIQPDEKAYAARFHNALEYVLMMHKNVGMFRNSLGDLKTLSWFTAPFADPYVMAAGGWQRWKSAPFTAEWYGAPLPIAPQIVLGLKEVPENHVALLADGALGPNPQLTAEQLQQIQMCGKLSGFRFQLDRVRGNRSATNKRSFDLVSYWENVGVTPVYEPWKVVYQLRTLGDQSAANQVVWQSAASLDLRQLLPTNGKPVVVSDALKIPTTVKSGTYQLFLVVEDPTHYYKKPLAIASAGAQADGSYSIAKIQIK